MYKYLFFIPSPRNIPEVKNEIVANIYKKHDVIWLKYYREIDAYKKARQFFLTSAENYDYLVIIPDDLLVNTQAFENLMAEIEKPSIDVKKYDILAGICNSSYINSEQMGQIAASNVELPTPDKTGGVLLWPHMIKFADLEKRKENILRCKFIGFSFYFIHKNVVRDIPFRVDNPDRQQGGVDVFFSADLNAQGIDQYIDKRSRFVHLRGLSAQNMKSISVNPDVMLVGKIKPHTILVKRERIVKGADMVPTLVKSEVINTAPIIEENRSIQTTEEELLGKPTEMQEHLAEIVYKKGGNSKTKYRQKNK